ncbi:Not1 N-terminal domain, CCR4-Not complex component-domain-containing protein [Myxozyma melibiosi]|uniref:General negative regulator of transcription subunit n=1 Tax=Myxozyma melibiosi TaxID=54550 RepID=A0ABR1FFG7_9ASCO
MAQRKLQQEIDRVLKRVAEGVQAFDALYDKLMMTTNQSQKEKLEQDLKREIKKLQRLRDQIKSWLSGNEIKDKKPLVDQRKLIESEMERFKACEKEMKTKAYSKEGLSVTRLDPREKEKMEMANFITSMIEDLDRQVEQKEAELELLQATVKRGKKDTSKAERIAEIESRIEQHKWHQGKLEVILRLLENGNLEVDQVASIQEDIKYYVESNQDADFADDDEMYDSLNLEEDEELFGMNDNDHQDSHSVHEEEEKKEINTPTVPLLVAKKAEATSVRKVSGKTSTSIPSSVAANPPPAAATASASTITSTTMKPAPAPRLGEGLKYASAAAAAAAAAASNTPGLAPLPPPPSGTAAAASKSSGEKTQGTTVSRSTSAVSSPLTSFSTVATAATAQNGSSEKAATSTAEPESQKASVPAAAAPAASNDSATSAASSTTQKDGAFNMKEMEAALKKSTESLDSQQREKTPDLVQSGTTTSSERPALPLPNGLQDLATAFETAKERVQNPPSPEAISKMVEASFRSCPEAVDADKPKHYVPKTPFPTASYFPQEPLAVFDDPLLYEKVDIDTLFYVFYYRQGTYQQYLAAQELKKQSWRFHKKFLTWFQRHEEPKVITDDYEQGTYRYFDFEGTWLQRRKANFEFEYQYLEDEM